MKKITTLFLLALLPLLASAYDAEVDGIYYNLNADTKEAEVTSGSSSYSGNVNIPSSVTYNGVTYCVISIGDLAFGSCYELLTEVTIPNSVTTIGSGAFSGCSGLTEVNIPNSVTEIGNNAFEACFALTEVTIPNSVKSIGSGAFSDCFALTEVTIPNSVIEIGLGAFSGTAWYENQPDGVLYAGKVACEYKGTMPENTSISIKEGTIGISSRAFTYCKELTSVTIPNSVTFIGSRAFESCSGLTSIIVESGNTKYDSRGNCNAIIETATNTLITGCKNTIIPNSVSSIGSGAFYGCSGLTEVNIPNSVTSIGGSAFMYCYYLTSVTIPNSVTEIGIYAFYNTGLTNVYCYAEKVPKTGNNIFSSTNIKKGTLYVPGASVNSYKAATPWYRFGSIKAIEDATGVKNISANGDGTADKAKGTADGKYLKGGKLVIVKGGKEYNAAGMVK